jgi:hypothetical protein
MLQFVAFATRKRALAATILTFAILTIACSRSNDTVIGTFRMGEQVQAGPIVYTVLEANWKPALESGKMPKHRFLYVKVSITNSSGQQVAIPAFSLLDPKGTTYTEISEGLEQTTGWLGMLRSLKPAQTDQGLVVFDAPIGPYKLAMSDAGEVGRERYIHVDIPVQMEVESQTD